MYIAMNRFHITPGREAEFEQTWRNRESYLDQQPGFVQFALLRNDESNPQYTEYVSHTIWQSREAFQGWVNSQDFQASHARAGSSTGVMMGHPQVSLYDAVIEQHPAVKA